MLGKDKALELLHDALGYTKADQTEIVYSGSESALTRFANSYIHQNVSESNTSVTVRAIFGQKIGIATGNDLSPDGMRALVARAEEVARLQVEDADFKALPSPVDFTGVNAFDNDTAYCSPETRAAMVGQITDYARSKDVRASGALTTGGYEIGVVNSLGVSAFHPFASASLVVVVDHPTDTGSGYAARSSPRVTDIDAAAAGREAVDKAVATRNPRTLEPGNYEVLLDEYAVGTMLQYMSWLGMGAQAVQEGRSFMQFERQIMNDKVTIYDDGYDPRNVALPFDFEGVPRQRVNIIEKGIAKNVVYDSYLAGREPGRRSTGHALPAGSDIGAIPLHLFMEAGDSTKTEMIRSIKRGLWVTRFHYVNPLVPDKAVLTGMTRDGTFLIENGEIVGPVKNFRFTQSAVEALNNVELISRERMLVGSEYGGASGVYVPAIKCSSFTFNSGTDF